MSRSDSKKRRGLWPGNKFPSFNLEPACELLRNRKAGRGWISCFENGWVRHLRNGSIYLLFTFVTSAALSTTPQLHGGMTFVCMYDTLHPPPRTAAAAVVWYRAQSTQRTDCTKKKDTNMLILIILCCVVCCLLSAVCCLLCAAAVCGVFEFVGGALVGTPRV